MNEILGNHLFFRNGKTSPERVENGQFTVFGSNGPIGQTNEKNANGPFIVIGRVGSYCGSLYYSEHDAWVTDNAIVCTSISPAETRYWHYLLQTLDLNSRSSGSGQPLLNQTVLGSIEAAIANPAHRETIAEVLGALDDKIAANTKLAATAAQLTHAIFTRAVRESSEEFVLSEITDLLSRGVTPKYSEDEETMMILNQKCVRGQRIELEPARRTLLTKVRGDKVLVVNDVLVNSTGQGTLGRVARWTNQERATVDSHITIVRFDAAKVHPVTAGIGLLGMQETIIEMGEGSTGQTELSRVELGKLKVRLPRRDHQAELGLRFSELSRMESAHLAENTTLATTRDVLLPQLMSGKLRVKDAESVISAAV